MQRRPSRGLAAGDTPRSYRLSNRAALYTLILLAPLVWGACLVFTHFVPPRSFLAFATFFVLLGGALVCTLSPLAYLISLRFTSSRLYRATVRHSLRQGMLLTICIVLNLILRALHSWNIFMAIILLAAAIVVEVLSLARKL